jgi:RNA polymerase-associated protein CTR9
VQYDLKLAGIEANCCQDLMNQADYHVKRARQKDIEEREIRQKREKELELLIVKQNEDKANELQFEEGKKNEILKKRQEYLEKTKNAIMMFHTTIESPKLKRKPRMKKSSAHGGSFSSSEEENKCSKKSKKR